jgi:hypothetical protein
MEGNHTLSLALFDFVPNLAFLAGGYFLVRMAIQTRGKTSGQVMAAGTGLVFLGGMLKATWKLLLTLEIADVQLFSEAQFALQAPGFLLMLVAMVQIIRTDSPGATTLGAMAAWKIPFLVVMTLADLGVLGLCITLALRWRKRLAAILFVLAVFLTLGMSGMAGGSEQTLGNQWIEESINSLGQIAFALGSYLLQLTH